MITWFCDWLFLPPVSSSSFFGGCTLLIELFLCLWLRILRLLWFWVFRFFCRWLRFYSPSLTGLQGRLIFFGALFLTLLLTLRSWIFEGKAEVVVSIATAPWRTIRFWHHFVYFLFSHFSRVHFGHVSQCRKLVLISRKCARARNLNHMRIDFNLIVSRDSKDTHVYNFMSCLATSCLIVGYFSL